MIDDIRKTVGSSLDALSRQAPEEVTAALVAGAAAAAEQLLKVATGLLQWSAGTREGLTREVRGIVARQVSEMGLASRKDLEALAHRVGRLEGAATAGDESGKQAPAKGSAHKKPARPKASARKAEKLNIRGAGGSAGGSADD